MVSLSLLRSGSALLVLSATLVACESTTDLEAVELAIVPQTGLAVGIGGRERFRVEARAADGKRFEPEGASWEVDDRGIATVNADGVATAVAVGRTAITVMQDGLSATAELEVYVPPTVEVYEPRVSYFGRNDYIEYVPGELPVVLSAPHGGDLLPEELLDRTAGVIVPDTNTRPLILAIRDALVDLTGAAPHVVISHLARVKLDPNREVGEAAQNDPFAEHAWDEYHGYIDRARLVLASNFGGGMYFDLHGHGHPKDRLELGYLLSADELNRPDVLLDNLATVQLTSIREIGRTSPIPFSQLLRGPTSFGGLLEDRGVPAVPSPADPSPGADPYFSGGYSTRRHGSMADTELVSGIQIEHHFPGLRDTDANRRAYAALLAEAIRAFMLEHLGFFEPPA